MRQDTSYFSSAIDDLCLGVKNHSLWMTLGWNDIRTRYHRSKLGAFWASLSILIFISALGPIYSSLLGVGVREYTLHLMLGMIVWNYISSITLECGREYVSAANYLVSFQISYFTLLLRVVWRNLVVLCYQMSMFLLFALIFQHPISLNWLLAPLALLLITLTALALGLAMSVIATRYRDMSELINNLLRLVFFATPIMWMPNDNEQIQLITDLNPFFHLIEIFRGPLLNSSLNTLNWTIVATLMMASWLLAFPLFAKLRSRIAFWL